MIYSSIKSKTEPLSVSIIGFLLFGLSVSIDSFTTGIGMNIINSNYIQVSTTFSILSCLFTYIGLILGNKINKSFGPTSSLIGGTILLILAIYYYTI
jgi:putative Mn2+ efflux pump MntP